MKGERQEEGDGGRVREEGEKQTQRFRERKGGKRSERQRTERTGLEETMNGPG